MGWEADIADDGLSFDDLKKPTAAPDLLGDASREAIAGSRAYAPFGAFGPTAGQETPQTFPTEMRAWTPEERARLNAQKPAIGKTDLGGERPSIFGVAGEAGRQGFVEGVTNTARAGTAFQDRSNDWLANQPEGETSQLLRQNFSEGWKDPRWWVAHMARGTAEASPSLAAGLGGGVAGGAVGGPVGATAGAAAGFGLGSLVQSLAPAYQRARSEGLDHQQAVDRAITESGISGVTGALMGVAPGLSLFGRNAEGALKKPISEALAQIFGVQPGIGAAGTVASRAATGQALPTADELATQYATQVGTGAVLTGMQAGARAAPKWWEIARDRWLKSQEPEIPVTPLTRAADTGTAVGAARPGEVDLGDLIPDRTRLAAPNKRIEAQPEEPAPQAGAMPPSAPVTPEGPGQPPVPGRPVTPEVLPAQGRQLPEIVVEAASVPPALRSGVITETLKQMQATPQVAGLLRAEQQRTGETPTQVIDRMVGEIPFANQFAQAANEVALTGRASRSAQPLAQALGQELAKPVEARAPEAATPPSAAGQPAGQRGVDVLQFIRSKGGLKPSGELRNLDALRYPGLINRNGLSADDMRKAMVEAGYLQESGHDQPAITTPADVYDLLARTISGERIVPQADRQADEHFAETARQKNEARELKGAEKTFVIPEIKKYDAEFGGGDALWRAYAGLSPDEKAHVIDRNRRGEGIVDILEGLTTQDERYYALGAPAKKAADRDTLGYYSKALESAKALKQETGTPQQMLAQLRTAGVKESEINATALDTFMKGKAAAGGKVTKQEIVDFLDKNRVALKESKYGGLDLDNLSHDMREGLRENEVDSLMGEGPYRGDGAYDVWFDEDEGRWTYGLYGEPSRTSFGEQELFDSEDEAKTELREMLEGEVRNMSDRELAERHLPQEQLDVAKGLKGEAKWRDYALDPDNPTYRESVIHLHQSEYEQNFNRIEDLQAAQRKLGSHSADNPKMEGENLVKANKLSDEISALMQRQSKIESETFKSGHWPEPNIVAHIRTAEYQDTKGRKVFNLDELQSDWGQKIREGGARDEEKIAKLEQQKDAANQASAAHAAQGDDLFRKAVTTAFEATGKTLPGDVLEHDYKLKNGEERGFSSNSRVLALNSVASFLEDEAGDKSFSAPVKAWINENARLANETRRIGAELSTAKAATPSHPLVNTTDQWVTTAMRRVIQQAVDAGADGISITPGKVQAERFSLGHNGVDGLAYDPDDQQLFIKRDQQWDSVATVTPASLPDFIGKEMASELLAVEREDASFGHYAHVLDNLGGVSIGGEGMKATYDNIYPRILGKLLQKLDPSIKAEKTRLLMHGDTEPPSGGRYAMSPQFNENFTFFPLTAKAKEKLAEDGQPMFALGAKNGRDQRAGDGTGRTEGGSLAPLKGAPGVAGATGPDPGIVAAAEDYARSIGIDLKRQAVFAEIDEGLATRIANAYDVMQHTPNDPRVRAAYDDMIVQTINQYRALERAGYKFFFYDEATDPYQGNPWNSIRDLRTNQRMGVFATEAGFGSGATDLDTSDSPMLIDTGIQWPYGSLEGPTKRVLANDLFRAVHDAFGHSIEGAGFRARGEENAWQAHIRLYTGLAQGAVTTETRGQNSWLNFGPYGAANRNASVEDTVFADQKIGLMPEFTWQEGRAPDEMAPVDKALGVVKKTDAEVRNHIGAFLKMGRSVDLKHADDVLDQVRGVEAIVPEGTPYGALTKITPIKGQKGRVTATFKMDSGKELQLPFTWETLASTRAFFRPLAGGVSGGLFLSRLDVPAQGDKRIIGEVRHESIHALRHVGALVGDRWDRLLAHAKDLHILDSDLRTYLQAIGNPTYRDAAPGVTTLELYQELYKDRKDPQEKIDQEHVAHMAELYSHGVFLPQEIAPVKDLLDAIFAGDFSKPHNAMETVNGELEDAAAFAGPWAKTAKEHPLILAKRLTELGHSREAIWKRTGWFKGADGKWRFEIDDSDAGLRLKPDALLRASGGKAESQVLLGKLLRHPGLFEAYPHLLDIPVYLDPGSELTTGGHRGRTMAPDASLPEQRYIVLGLRGYRPTPQDSHKLLSTLLHEIQHEIQDEENFATGGSPENFGNDFLTRLGSGELSAMDRKILDSDAVKPTYKQWLLSVRGLAALPNDKDRRELARFMLTRLADRVAFEHYQRLGGEVEAREVQQRIRLGEESRQTSWPMPVAADEQNVQFPYADKRYSDVSLALQQPHETQTETPAFKRWFGDSKVVNAEGKPLVVYHGTGSSQIAEFRPFSHFGTQRSALDRVENERVKDVDKNIIPVYLSIRNPLRIRDDGLFDGLDLLLQTDNSHGLTEKSFNEINEYASENGIDDHFWSLFEKSMRASGHDGFVYKNAHEDAGKDSWIAISPTQIKSAIGNRGTFDPSDERIAYALAGPRAIGAPKEALKAGQTLEAQGRTAEQIWQATGTLRGIEGKQRWEIDDSGAKIIGLDKAFQTPQKSGFLSRLLGRAPAPKPGIREANNVPLLNVLHHPKLFNAYPFLRQMRVNLAYGDMATQEGALRSRKKNGTRIYMPIEASAATPKALLEVLMHEIQHYIQDREGFARGSDFVHTVPRQFGPEGGALYDPGKDLSEEERSDYRNVARDRTLLKMTRPEAIAYRIMTEFEHLDQAETPRDREHAQQHIEQLGKQLEEAMLVKDDDYAGSYGEHEANAVEQRLGMTPEQRRATFPAAGLPETLRDTSSQTRDYQKAYDEVMRRAGIFKQIEERWKERKSLGDGVNVVRPHEDMLLYAGKPEEGWIEVQMHPMVAGGTISFWPEFLALPYREQKKIMDVAIRDMRSRNLRPEIGSEPSDEEIAFWGRYNPRMVAFHARFYRGEIEAMARQHYGDDAQIHFYDDGEVVVTTPEMQRKYAAYREKRDANVQAYMDFRAKMVEKYGGINEMFQKGEPQESQKYNDLARKADDFGPKPDEKAERYLNLAPIFGDRTHRGGAPEGVDRDMWEETLIDEQLAHMDKVSSAGDEFDFSDLIPAK